MELLRDRRVLIALALALLAGVGLAIFLITGEQQKEPPPASQSGLIVEAGKPEDFKTKAELRCFVNGQFAGLLTLNECAQKNGVATTALDVGVDESGALAAAETVGATLAPLPPTLPAPAVIAPPPAAPAVPAASEPSRATASCQRYERTWAKLGDMTLNTCIQALFAGRCERAGAASYGRWGDQTLRLVTGRVEVSADDRSFRTLVDPGPNCSTPPL